MTEGEAKLARMAGEIHRFFRHQGDGAVPAAANHLRQFWPPGMRADFVALAAREPDALAPETRAIAEALEPGAEP